MASSRWQVKKTENFPLVDNCVRLAIDYFYCLSCVSFVFDLLRHIALVAKKRGGKWRKNVAFFGGEVWIRVAGPYLGSTGAIV